MDTSQFMNQIQYVKVFFVKISIQLPFPIISQNPFIGLLPHDI